MREPFTFISTFSGVGGFDLGLEQAGMTCVAQIEYDPHWRCKNGHEFVPELSEAAGPCETIIPKTQTVCGQPMKPPLPAEKQYRPQVLERHWPGVTRYGDIRAVSLQPNGLQERELGGARSGVANPKGRKKLPRHARVQRAASDEQGESKQPTTERPVPHAGRGRTKCADLICGGFPCQDLSVAGRRAGLAGSRSGLFWEFARLASEVRPTWLLIENVPGLLSSNGGDDFALILSALEELGYGWAYRILDSRHFGVPQRRRRVYIVGHSSGRCDYPASVLFESEGGARDSEESGEAGEDVAREIGDGVAATLGAGRKRGGQSTDLDNTTYVASIPHGTQWRGADRETYVPEVVGALDGTFGHHGLAHSAQSAVAGHYIAGTVTGSEGHNGNSNPIPDNYVTETLRSSNYGNHGESEIVLQPQTVRRLTPVECERLQGFPDNWTHGADGPRYAAMGDAVTVPVIRWLGERMMFVEESLRV